jgi:tRNA-modifying protein YgfZ
MPETTLRDRALIRLSGGEARPFLDGLVTNALPATGGQPRWAGLLTPQGKALFDFMVWAEGEDLLIDCEAEQRDALVRRLSMYRLRRPVTIAAEDELAVHWSPSGHDLADPRQRDLGSRWLAPPLAGDAAAQFRAHRLAFGVVEGAVELGQDRTLWLEANARELNGVSFDKGCYVGQENTARMHHRAKVNRRLVVVRTDVDPGDKVRAWYPDLGLAVAHLRVEAIGGLDWAEPIVPTWLAAAIAEARAAV